MAFCSNCGAEMTGAFCGKCGSGAAAAKPAAGGGGSSSTPLTDNAAAALCYLFGVFTGVLFLVWAPYSQNKNIRFHAYQSILLMAAWIGIHILLSFFPWSVRYPLGSLLQVAGLLLWLFMMWKAYNNEKIVLPVIGPVAEKQA